MQRTETGRPRVACHSFYAGGCDSPTPVVREHGVAYNTDSSFRIVLAMMEEGKPHSFIA